MDIHLKEIPSENTRVYYISSIGYDKGTMRFGRVLSKEKINSHFSVNLQRDLEIHKPLYCYWEDSASYGWMPLHRCYPEIDVGDMEDDL